jgi:hypothetical protein
MPKVSSKKNTELMVAPDEQMLAELRANTPQEKGFDRIMLPRLSFASQDKMEGEGKNKKVVVEAGTFFTEKQSEEVDEEGKKLWEKTELGNTIEATVIYTRKQLRLYDEATEKYTSSPIYDTDEEIIPLFLDKKEIARGTSKDLKAMYAYKGEDGKTKSKLEENRVLYVLYEGEVYQMSLRGSSMYSWLSWVRTTLPSSVLTEISSESRSKGKIEWNAMTFKALRSLSAEEVGKVIELQREIKHGIQAEKEYYASINTDVEEETDEEREIRTGNSLMSGKDF